MEMPRFLRESEPPASRSLSTTSSDRRFPFCHLCLDKVAYEIVVHLLNRVWTEAFRLRPESFVALAWILVVLEPSHFPHSF